MARQRQARDDSEREHGSANGQREASRGATAQQQDQQYGAGQAE